MPELFIGVRARSGTVLAQVSPKLKRASRMHTFDTGIVSDREAQRISTAFYRFLERHSDEDIEVASMQIQPAGHRQQIAIRLWSEQALSEFQRHVAAFTVPIPAGVLAMATYA